MRVDTVIIIGPGTAGLDAAAFDALEALAGIGDPEVLAAFRSLGKR